MSSDLREHDLREFLERMAREMPTPIDVPPVAIRRARTRLVRTVVASVVAAAIALAGALGAARALLLVQPRPADESARDAIVAAIAVGGKPTHVAVGDGLVWVAGTSVSSVDPATNRVVATYRGESRPEGSAIAVGEGAVWVSGGAFDGEVLRIDPGSGEVVTIHSGGGYSDPYAVVAGAGSVWATNDGEGTLVRIDPSTEIDELAGTIDLPALHAYGLTILDETVWVVAKDVDGGAGVLVGVDPATGATVATWPVDVFDQVEAGFGSLWAPGSGVVADATVHRIDPTTGDILATVEVPYLDEAPRFPSPLNVPRQRIAVGEGAVWVAVTDRRPDGSMRGRIIRIDPATDEIVGEIAIETPVAGMAAGAGALWVTDGFGTLYRIDPDAVTSGEGS